MTSTQTKLLTIFAPAKINLYLHVTGRLDNGYHTLDSLVSFADIGDVITIEPSSDFSFHLEGPFAGAFGPKERDESPNSSNLAVRAMWMLAQAAQKHPHLKITLTKNLPLSSGLGGGSSNAASVLWGLCEWWGISHQAPYLPGLMATLGADVPVCLKCQPTRMRGIGEILDAVPPMPEIAIVLINPGKPCPTGQVFAHFAGEFHDPTPLPESIETVDGLLDILKTRNNQLLDSAIQIVPEIVNVIQAMEIQDGCKLARLSGSGATCFGLFETEGQAATAAAEIADENPDWWVQSAWLNRPERY